MRELAGAPPRLVRRLVGALLLVAPPARGRYPALGAIFGVSFAASRFATHGAQTSRTPWPLGTLPFPVRLLMETLLPVALPLPVAPLLRLPCFLVPVLLLAAAAHGAPPTPPCGHVGALPPFVRRLVADFAAWRPSAIDRCSVPCGAL